MAFPSRVGDTKGESEARRDVAELRERDLPTRTAPIGVRTKPASAMAPPKLKSNIDVR